MKSEIKLIKVAQKNILDESQAILDRMNRQFGDQEKEQSSLDRSEKKTNRYIFIKQKAKEMNISIRDFIENFGTYEDRKFLELADREEKPEPNQVSIESYNKVLEIFEFLKKTSEEKNIPIRAVLENLNVGGEMLGKLLPLVSEYERLKKEEQRIQKENDERTEADRVQKINSPEEKLRAATDRARFFTEEWNNVIKDAEAQNMDPVTYIRIHYPENLAYEIIAWHMLKSGQKTPDNIHEYLASLVNEISDEQVQEINQEYSENDFQNLVDEAREVIENIDWEKVGAYLSDGVNNVIYQLLKPGSVIKKTKDSIRAIVSLLTLKNSDQFSEEYEQERVNRDQAEQELDEYLKKEANKMNKRQIIASIENITNILEENGMFEDAFKLSNVKRKITSSIETNDINQVMSQVNMLSRTLNEELETLNRLFKRLQQELYSQYGRDEEMLVRLNNKIKNTFEEADVTRKKLSGKVQEISSLSNNVNQNAQPESSFESTNLTPLKAPTEEYSEFLRNKFE